MTANVRRLEVLLAAAPAATQEWVDEIAFDVALDSMLLIPFAFAIGLCFSAALDFREAPDSADYLPLAAISCGLLGMSNSLMFALARSRDN